MPWFILSRLQPYLDRRKIFVSWRVNVLTDKTKAKRADDTEKRLEKLVVADRNELDDLKYYKTPDFLKPRDLDPTNFQPCEVGFSWSRNRQHGPKERRQITGELARGGKLREQLSIGDSVWFHLSFQIPESMKGLPFTSFLW